MSDDKKSWYAGGDKATKVKASGSSRMPGCHTNFRRITFHSEGVDRTCDGGAHVASLARYVVQQNIYYHMVYCPDCGHWAQIIPIEHAARAMKGGSVCSAGNSANRHGLLNIQICIAAYGTSAKKLPPPSKWKNTKKFKKIVDDWDINPKALDYSKQIRSKEKWCKEGKGFAGHQHGPTDDHNDIQPNKFDFKAFKKDVLKK